MTASRCRTFVLTILVLATASAWAENAPDDPVTIRVRVLDHAGDPVTGVTAWLGNADRSYGAESWHHELILDADGEAEIIETRSALPEMIGCSVGRIMSGPSTNRKNQIEHYKTLITTNAFPTLSDIEFPLDQDELELVIQAIPAVMRDIHIRLGDHDLTDNTWAHRQDIYMTSFLGMVSLNGSIQQRTIRAIPKGKDLQLEVHSPINQDAAIVGQHEPDLGGIPKHFFTPRMVRRVTIPGDELLEPAGTANVHLEPLELDATIWIDLLENGEMVKVPSVVSGIMVDLFEENGRYVLQCMASWRHRTGTPENDLMVHLPVHVPAGTYYVIGLHDRMQHKNAWTLLDILEAGRGDVFEEAGATKFTAQAGDYRTLVDPPDNAENVHYRIIDLWEQEQAEDD